tara:strand:+ start:1274 stop:2347 length:1074 start_codon:yes stop_codon:yes gene_type:complete
LKRTKIYFIGKKQGIGFRRYRLSHLENRRKLESEGLRDAYQKIKQVRSINNADVIWVRVRPEHTTDHQRQVIEKRIKNRRKKIPIINDICIFDNYDCKDISFDLWKKNDIKCPDHLTIVPESVQKYFNETIQDISFFIRKNKKIFLRTNNETASNGMFILDTSSTEKEIEETLSILINRCKSFFLTRRATRIIAVKFISPVQENNYQDLYRVHILFGKILSFYAVTSKRDIFHNVDMDHNDIDRFIQLNEHLCNEMPNLKDTVIKSAESLGCNLGAVEFFLLDGQPLFIELNPMWGGHASMHGFGDKRMQTYLISNRNSLEKRIPNIYQFMDRKDYYKNLYEQIHLFVNKPTGTSIG